MIVFNMPSDCLVVSLRRNQKLCKKLLLDNNRATENNANSDVPANLAHGFKASHKMATQSK